MLLTDDEISKLLAGVPITDLFPWSTEDDKVIEDYVRLIVTELTQKHQLLDKTEYNHYGSGTASFIESWLYRQDDEFRTPDCGHGEHCYFGLYVLFSRLSNFYAIGQSTKFWDEERGTGGAEMPSFWSLDQITQPAIHVLAYEIMRDLDTHRLVNLTADDLSGTLPEEIDVPTILGGPHVQFNALFYWSD